MKKNILKLRTFQEYIDKIARGEKKSEYRKICTFYVKKMCTKLENGKYRIINFDKLFLYANSKKGVLCDIESINYLRFNESNLVEDFELGNFVFEIKLKNPILVDECP